LLPKDNENVPLPISTTLEPEDFGPSAFAPDQMVRCDECLRANPPTRINCLYCAAVLPHNETTARLRQPTLRPLEKWELGYNNILLPPVANLNDDVVNDVAALLRLHAEDLRPILSSSMPLPLARTATNEEAQLVQRRLSDLGIDSLIVPDAEPGIDDPSPVKVRAIEIVEAGIIAYHNPDGPGTPISWSDFELLVTGRLIVKRLEQKEQRKSREENRILAASEFATDEMVSDFYTRTQTIPYRIAANSFDFSCLGSGKSLVAAENIADLLRLFREHAPQAGYDEAFNSVRKTLEPVWPYEQESQSTGWRRQPFGRYSLGSVLELNNERQFLRYSRLRHYLQTHTPPAPGGN
jgi:hypothetical protein